MVKVGITHLLGGRIKFILDGWHEDDPKLVGHGKDGYLATGPRNLTFMAACFKNAMVYEVQNRHISYARGNRTQFGCKWVNGQGLNV